MMQDARTMAPGLVSYGGMSAQGLAALLALAGSRQLDVATLRRRMKLDEQGFASMLDWLQREYLVDVVCRPEGGQAKETVELTDRGESVLLGLLERMCELPEFH